MTNYWKNRRVCVTGAAGFIGSHVVDALVANGARVSAIVSPATDKKKIKLNLGNHLDFLQIKKVDLLDIKQVSRALKNHEIIYHFAALDGGNEYKRSHPAEIFTKNTMMTLNMLNAARIESVNKIFLMSSIEVYPQSLKGIIEETNTETSTLPFEEGYSWAKRTSEVAAMLYAYEYGMTVIIGRAGNIYGPRDYGKSDKSRVIPNFILKALSNEDIYITTSKNRKIPFLFVEDFAKIAIQLIARQKSTEIFNIVSDRYVSLNQLAELIVNSTKSTSKINFSQDEDLKDENRFFSINKLKSVINLSNTLLEKGIDKTIEHFKSDML